MRRPALAVRYSGAEPKRSTGFRAGVSRALAKIENNFRRHKMAYSDKVIDHYNHPRNVGSLDKSSSEVGTGLVGAPECGDVMKLQIKVNPETNVIEDAKFKTF